MAGSGKTGPHLVTRIRKGPKTIVNSPPSGPIPFGTGPLGGLFVFRVIHIRSYPTVGAMHEFPEQE